MNKKLIIGVAIVLIVAIIGVFMFSNKAQSKEEFIIYETQLVQDAIRVYFSDAEAIMPDGYVIYTAEQLQTLVAKNMVYDSKGKVSTIKPGNYYNISDTDILKDAEIKSDGNYLINEEFEVIYIDVVIIDEWTDIPGKPGVSNMPASSIFGDYWNDLPKDEDTSDEGKEEDKYMGKELSEKEIKEIVRMVSKFAYSFSNDAKEYPLFVDRDMLVRQATKGHVYGFGREEAISPEVFDGSIDFLADPSCISIVFNEKGWPIEDHLFYPFDAVYLIAGEELFEATGYHIPGYLIYYYDQYEGSVDDQFCYDISGKTAFVLSEDAIAEPIE